MGKIPQHITSVPFLLSLILFVFWASSCNFYWEETTHFGQEWRALILIQLKKKKKRCKNLFTTRQGICTENLCLPQALWSIFTFPGWKSSENYFYHQGLIWLWSICTLKWLGDRANTAWLNQDVLYCKNVILRGVTAISNSKQPIAALFTHCIRDLGGHF